jgi:hypothetical protein
MSNDTLTRNVYYALNRELLRRMLTKYFFDKGFKENINKRIYPPTIQDIVFKIPQISGKVEIVPYVEDIDPYSNIVTLGWNLFVLGTKRMYLGESTHTSLAEIRNNIAGPIWSEGINSIEYVTPKKIISFIVEILGESRVGDLAKAPKQYKERAMPLLNRGDSSGWFRTQARPVL